MIHRANSGTKSNLLDQFNTVLLLIVTHSNSAHTSNRNTSVSKRTSTHHCPASHFPLGSSCWAPNDCPFSASNVHYKSCPFFFTAIIPDSNASLPPPCTLQTCRDACALMARRAPTGSDMSGTRTHSRAVLLTPRPLFPSMAQEHMRGEVKWLGIRGKYIYLSI